MIHMEVHINKENTWKRYIANSREGCLLPRNGDAHVMLYLSCVWCMRICVCRDQMSASGVFLHHSPHCFWRQRLTEPGAHQFGHAGQWATGILLFHTPTLGIEGMYALLFSAQLFTWVPKIWTQVLVLACRHFTYWVLPLFVQTKGQAISSSGSLRSLPPPARRECFNSEKLTSQPPMTKNTYSWYSHSCHRIFQVLIASRAFYSPKLHSWQGPQCRLVTWNAWGLHLSEGAERPP